MLERVRKIQDAGNGRRGVRSAAALLAAALMGLTGYSGQLAFFPFDDAADGTEVNTVSDDSGLYSGTAQATNADGQKPKFSSDGPGKVIVAGLGTVCAAPHSLLFRYKVDATHQSGYVDIPGLASALAGLSAFTVEYFVKMDENYDYSAGGSYARYSKTAFYLKSSTSAFKQILPTTISGTHAMSMTLQRYKGGAYSEPSSITSVGDLSDGKWHHVAIVFSETDSSTHEGTLTFYVRGEYVGETQYVNTQGSDLKFRIGSGYKDIGNNADKTTTESIHASLSCLRVCDTALAPNEFLVPDTAPDVSGLETIAFYPFKDGSAGAAATAVENTVDASLFPGTGANIGSGSVTFSAARPGRYVFADTRYSSVIQENPQSLCFVNGTSGNGGKMSLASLATVLSRLDAYTVEFFFMVQSTSDYRTLVGWKYGDRVGVKANMRISNGASYACEFQAVTNTTGGTVVTAGASGRIEKAMGAEWHHFAAVCTKSDDAIWTYIDGVRSDRATSVTNQHFAALLPLVLGTSAFSFKESTETFGGLISCVRVTSRALSPEAFMTASDEQVPPGTVFTVSFNEGTAGTRVLDGTTGTTGVPIYPDGGYANIAYNLHQVCTPQWGAAFKPGRMLQWDRWKMWENRLSLYFPAGSNASGQSNAGYYGAVFNVPIRASGFCQSSMNPASWTMEAFVKLEKYNLPHAISKTGLIFGKAGNTVPTGNNPVWYPRYSWLLSYTSEGRLRLEWTERPTPGFSSYEASSTDYYKRVDTGVSSLTDLKWHHVALSYDASAKRFVLYVDGGVVLTQPLLNAGDTNALFDGNFAYYFGRFPTTGGFEGWMDEIRFSSKVLQPEEFEQFSATGSSIIFR